MSTRAYLASGACVVVLGCGGALAPDDTGTSRPAGSEPAIDEPRPAPAPSTPLPPQTPGPTGPTSSTYEAHGYIGGLDRITIIKRDALRGVCFALLLVQPGGSTGFGIKTPQTWGVQSAWASKGAATCERFPGPTGTAQATSGTGWVSFTTGPGPYACSLSFDATLKFTPSPGLPATEPLKANDVFIDGFCARDAGRD